MTTQLIVDEVTRTVTLEVSSVGARGPSGPAGPTGVSADEGQQAALGTDGLVLVAGMARAADLAGLVERLTALEARQLPDGNEGDILRWVSGQWVASGDIYVE